MYVKDPYEAKYQLFVNKHENVGLKHCNDFMAFIEYSSDMNEIFENIDEYNPNKKLKILTVCDDMITNMFSNEQLQ